MKLQLIPNKKLSLSPNNGLRDGWKNAFKKMAQTSDDKLLDSDFIESTFDKEEWDTTSSAINISQLRIGIIIRFLIETI
jgi:hypothetical protein